MSEPFVGQIIMFAGNFAIRGWAQCNGQLMSIAQNTALFSLVGTFYGGDGRTTFGLPDFQGRLPMHNGSGPGLTSRQIGQKAGVEQVTLNINQLPSHNHLLEARDRVDNTHPGGGLFGTPAQNMYASGGSKVEASGQAISNTGVGTTAPHSNMQPYLSVTFLIALQGVYPSRS